MECKYSSIVENVLNVYTKSAEMLVQRSKHGMISSKVYGREGSFTPWYFIIHIITPALKGSLIIYKKHLKHM